MTDDIDVVCLETAINRWLVFSPTVNFSLCPEVRGLAVLYAMMILLPGVPMARSAIAGPLLDLIDNAPIPTSCTSA